MRSLLVVVALAVTTIAVGGQRWTPPRTPWGDPDLQGYWPSVDMLGVPLERPASLGNHATLSDEELAQLPAQRRIPNANDAFFGESRDHWREYGKPQRQTSLIVDPPNGRLPPMTPDGAQRSASLPNEARGPLNGPEDVSPMARCLSRGVFGSMMPIGNSSGNEIVQAPGVVVIRNEMIGEARVIPLDGRPHVGTPIRSYMGDSRGRWEGDTLVVETTNFKEKGGNGPSRLFTAAARMTERLTRTDAHTIRYEATVTDPKTWINRGPPSSRSDRTRAISSSSSPVTRGITGACDRCWEVRAWRRNEPSLSIGHVSDRGRCRCWSSSCQRRARRGFELDHLGARMRGRRSGDSQNIRVNVKTVITTTETGLPLTSVGLNCHCMTASTAALSSSGIDWSARALLTCPSGSTCASTITRPWTRAD